MTIAAAVLDRALGFVVLGADTEWWNGSVRVTGPCKVQRHHEWGAASAGPGWSQEMLTDCMEVLDEGVRAFRDACLEWSRDHGHGSVDDGHWSAPWSVLVAGPTGLWEVSGDGTILEPVLGYLAIGSGAPVAYGALHATRHLAPDVRVLLALEAACEHASGCGRPSPLLAINLQADAEEAG